MSILQSEREQENESERKKTVSRTFRNQSVPLSENLRLLLVSSTSSPGGHHRETPAVATCLCSLRLWRSLDFSVGVLTTQVEIPRVLMAGPKMQVPGALALSSVSGKSHFLTVVLGYPI